MRFFFLFPFSFLANGLRIGFDVNTSLNLSDIAFFPSQRFHSYDLYATAVDKEDVLFVDLHSGLQKIAKARIFISDVRTKKNDELAFSSAREAENASFRFPF